MEDKALDIFERNKKLMQHQGNQYGKTPLGFYESVYNTLTFGFRDLDAEELRLLAAAFKAMLVVIEGSQNHQPQRQPFRPRVV